MRNLSETNFFKTHSDGTNPVSYTHLDVYKRQALGSSTGMALAEHLTQTGRRSGAKVIAIGVQPFSFEGWARRERSIAAIATLRAECDSVLVLSHDRLEANPSLPRNVRHSFHIMHQLVAQAVQALAQVVCKDVYKRQGWAASSSWRAFPATSVARCA